MHFAAASIICWRLSRAFDRLDFGIFYFFPVSIPKNPEDYGISRTNTQMENYKNFFDKSYVESVDLLENELTIKKPYAEKIKFNFIDFGYKQTILDNIKESFNPWDFAEIIYLSKYIGDYNITKYGNKLTFENAGKTLVLERVQ